MQVDPPASPTANDAMVVETAAPRPKRKRPAPKAIARPKAVPAYQLWLQASHADLRGAKPSEAWKALPASERQIWLDQAVALREAAEEALDDDDDDDDDDNDEDA